MTDAPETFAFQGKSKRNDEKEEKASEKGRSIEKEGGKKAWRSLDRS